MLCGRKPRWRCSGLSSSRLGRPRCRCSSQFQSGGMGSLLAILRHRCQATAECRRLATLECRRLRGRRVLRLRGCSRNRRLLQRHLLCRAMLSRRLGFSATPGQHCKLRRRRQRRHRRHRGGPSSLARCQCQAVAMLHSPRWPLRRRWRHQPPLTSRQRLGRLRSWRRRRWLQKPRLQGARRPPRPEVQVRR